MARLSTGEQVAVKVQYPGLENCISADLSTIGVLSRLASMMFPEVKLAWLFDELQKKLEIELDFRWVPPRQVLRQAAAPMSF